MQILLSIPCTLIGLFLAFIFSLGEPYYVGATNAILSVSLLNALWLIPYSIFYFKKKDNRGMRFAMGVYLIVVLLFVIDRFYNKPFDSNRWKTELDHTRIYDRYPAHANGDMVPDIISSKILIGLSLSDTRKVLGENYYITVHETDTTLWYYYSNKKIFDGCDQLCVSIKNGRCTDTNFGNCD